tara:strand:+ start:1301 stop:1936 length:636 start_codon:yes stop_codon:yes gene_type:complete
MGQLTGQKIKNSYKDLLQISNSNQGVDATLRQIEDGEGHGASIKLSQTKFETINDEVMNSSLVTFVHNFADDLGTTNHYLPWSDEIESDAGGGRYYYAVPFSSMTLRRAVFRLRTVNLNSQFTLKMYMLNSGSAVTSTNLQEIAECQWNQTGSSDTSYVINTSDFNQSPTISTNSISDGNMKLLALRLQSSADFQASSNEMYVTTTWGVTL